MRAIVNIEIFRRFLENDNNFKFQPKKGNFLVAALEKSFGRRFSWGKCNLVRVPLRRNHH